MEIFPANNFHRKIEKIVQAIYLASLHLKDTEPLKWELRKESLAFLAFSHSISEADEPQDVSPDMVLRGFYSCAENVTSYLRLAFVAGLVLKNNAEMIIEEIEIILKSIEQYGKDSIAKAGFVLSDEFFKQLDKGHNESEKKVFPTKTGTLKMPEDKKNIKDKKESRQDRIIALLKNQANLTIKDFVRVISDCSEKTIQRELTGLVDRGIVKKEGERRWSKYSLK